jgi:NADH-quinone oxidoreductase subunit N
MESSSQTDASIGLSFALILVLCGLFFKIGGAPFHQWVPDVYEGAPTPVTFFFAVLPKISMVLFLVHWVPGLVGSLVGDTNEFVQSWMVCIGMASIAVASFSALYQRKLKRFLAYSSIGHVGFLTLGMAASSTMGSEGTFLYLMIYAVTGLGVWSWILLVEARKEGSGLLPNRTLYLTDFVNLGRQQPMLALAMAVWFFSMAGVPPLGGFFAKFHVLSATVEEGLYMGALFALGCSVLSAFYYLRVVKLLYIDKGSVHTTLSKGVQAAETTSLPANAGPSLGSLDEVAPVSQDVPHPGTQWTAWAAHVSAFSFCFLVAYPMLASTMHVWAQALVL